VRENTTNQVFKSDKIIKETYFVNNKGESPQGLFKKVRREVNYKIWKIASCEAILRNKISEGLKK
jgi:hypothetical protein